MKILFPIFLITILSLLNLVTYYFNYSYSYSYFFIHEDEDHPLFIMMVGIPGIGKSFLSNAISKALQCPRFCQDEVGDRVFSFFNKKNFF